MHHRSQNLSHIKPEDVRLRGPLRKFMFQRVAVSGCKVRSVWGSGFLLDMDVRSVGQVSVVGSRGKAG